MVDTCACHSLRGDVFRGHVVALDGAMTEVELEELYSPRGDSTLVPGARFKLQFSFGPIVCDAATPRPPLEEGDQVLVVMNVNVFRHAWLVPWTDPLDLGDRQVPLSTLAERADPSTCDADLEQPTCDDTSGCSMGRPRGSSPGVWPLAALLAALLGRGLLSRVKLR